MAADPYFTSVKLLMHMDGTDNGTTFTDVTGRTVTRTNAVTKTGIVKFGTASAYFDGSGDYLTIPYDADAWNWYATDWTLEYWVYPVLLSTFSAGTGLQVSRAVGLMSTGDATNYWSFGPRFNGTVGFFYNPFVQFVTTATVSENQWSHIAAVKSSAGLRIFVNGVGQLFTISTTPTFASTTLAIGQYQGTINGYIDDLRITKGVARYSADFSVPTEVFPDSLLELQTPQQVASRIVNPTARSINRIFHQGL